MQFQNILAFLALGAIPAFAAPVDAPVDGPVEARGYGNYGNCK